jgi:hypothetical protein
MSAMLGQQTGAREEQHCSDKQHRHSAHLYAPSGNQDFSLTPPQFSLWMKLGQPRKDTVNFRKHL